MIKFSISLPKYRLHLRLVRRRKLLFEKPLLPDLEDIKNTKSGNKISRFFRHVFEHRNIRRILGTNLALVVIATSFIPSQTLANIEAEQVVISEGKIPLVTEKSSQYPLDKVVVSQGYRFLHPGIDFDGVTGDAIKPIKAGYVEAIFYSKYLYGNAVVINHGSRITSLYAHLSKIYVKEGDAVNTNSVIGEMGRTGRASGDHLHLEIRDRGRPINPYTILPR